MNREKEQPHFIKSWALLEINEKLKERIGWTIL